MIEVRNLVKEFPGRRAVDDISFTVRKGEILGFLGPNGAGKTTTMRILTGFMPATGGQVTVGGHDVFDEPDETRRRLGYMPENVPLYPEMRVDEYLEFRARLRKVPASRRQAQIGRAMEMCRVTDRRRQVIGTLSKGYRQRVGQADALVGQPEYLVLDEPTVGLDPKQIREVRSLVRELGRDHTILLSTHILPEVEMTCSRVIIIDNGKIVAQDTTEALRAAQQASTEVVVHARLPMPDGGASTSPVPAAREALMGLPGVLAVTVEDDAAVAKLRIKAGGKDDVREGIFRLAVAKGWVLLEMRREALSLEDIFVKLTESPEPGEA
ncbi:MAG TPA: ABC transporter ATP-binding protein [Myxococcota bacterium]|nr:ABC transporter ATP-binding protein [Myxococcota bacterium]